VMTTCIGSMVLAAVGLLDGKRATINKQVIDIVEKRFPETEWVRDERWVVDGKFWTGGGAITGIDMMYALMKSDRFQLGGLPEAAAAFLEYTPRPQKYT
jgi:transcriptional regulator GlxA family with amidase domain